MLLTEHGQVYTWGGVSRGQLGHGTLASEERPRSVHNGKFMRIKADIHHGSKIGTFVEILMS